MCRHHFINSDFRKKVFKDQVENIDSKIKSELEEFRNDYDQQQTKESIVARDADILECLLQAKEYLDSGHKKAEKFFKKAPDHLKTKSAQACWANIENWDSSQWWEDVVKFER